MTAKIGGNLSVKKFSCRTGHTYIVKAELVWVIVMMNFRSCYVVLCILCSYWTPGGCKAWTRWLRTVEGPWTESWTLSFKTRSHRGRLPTSQWAIGSSPTPVVKRELQAGQVWEAIMEATSSSCRANQSCSSHHFERKAPIKCVFVFLWQYYTFLLYMYIYLVLFGLLIS